MLAGWGASAFHATDFYSGYEEFMRATPERKERFERDSRAIPKLVGSKASRILAVSFRPAEYIEKSSPEWKATLGTSAHSMAVQFILVSMGYWAKKHHHHDGFAYFMEWGDTDAAEVLQAVEHMRSRPGLKAHMQIKSFTPIEKGPRGLEASDFTAWHWNKHYMDRIRSGHDARKDFAAFMGTAEEKFDVAFLTGDKLLQYFAVFEEQIKEWIAAV